MPFDKARIEEQDGAKLLVVEGEAPCANMQVSLMPLVYIRQPEYWGIEVIGYLEGGICLPTVKPYTAAIRLDGIIGTEGIEVIGANRTERIACKP
ncbi:hypothetical protein AUC68_13985 [Methyloceanibacter methanicus]|uniref:Uncharacterized protein n=2 Tax=Methyloceanibacter methanicus TaxID=1774968 RepID=A0A1E3W4I7_9HYPH|nr:hypothetical protein AUC68_13985 [Methyloceanibacter methanicus]